MRKSIGIIICLVIVGVSVSLLHAKDKTAELYFQRGLGNYLKGDVEKTIYNVEKALKFDEKNQKMKAFLVKILTEEGSRLFMNKQYDKSLPYLEKAKWYDPENKDVSRMYDIVSKRNINSVSAGKVPASQKVSEEVLEPEMPEKQIIDQGSVERERIMRTLLASVQKQQEELIKAYTYPKDILRQVITNSEKERKFLLETLESNLKEQRRESSRTMIFVVCGVGAVVTIAYFIFFIMLSKREKSIFKHQEKILNIIQRQNLALAQGGTQLRLANKASELQEEDVVTPREMLNDPSPRIRSKGLDIVEAELVEEEEDSEVAQRLLEPFIKDEDNRVKATAIKILHRYEPEKAIKYIKEMIDTKDKWIRISAAWVLGEIPPNKAIVEMLISNIDDKDYHFKRRIVKALKKIMEGDSKGISKSLKEKIKKLLDNVRYDDKWVV